MITKLIDEFNFDPLSFFSDNEIKFGNIGSVIDDKDLIEKMEYIKSNQATIREKVTALTNSIVNHSDISERNKDNTMLLYKYIINHAFSHDIHKNRWVIQRYRQLGENYLLGNPSFDNTHLWAPLYILYPEYRDKTDRTRKYLNDPNKFSSDIDGIIEEDLNEPLSNREKKILNISDKSKKLNLVIGRYVYKNCVQNLKEFNSRSKDLIVGGISGHTILLLELALIIDIKWSPILIACIITQVPHHHSILEIVDAISEMKLINDEITESNYLDIVNRLIEGMNIKI
jgi:hypothetical protein